MIEVTHRNDAGIVVVTFHGRLDSSSSEAAAQSLDALMAPKPAGIILDLAGVSYCSSAGLRVLLMLVKRCRTNGIKLSLHSLTPNLVQVLDLSGLSSTFPIHPDAVTASAAMRA